MDLPECPSVIREDVIKYRINLSNFGTNGFHDFYQGLRDSGMNPLDSMLYRIMIDEISVTFGGEGMVNLERLDRNKWVKRIALCINSWPF